jgi:hypothetical protein
MQEQGLSTVKNLHNKIVYDEKTVECQHLIFCGGSQGRIYCHATKLGAKSEGFSRRFPLLVVTLYDSKHLYMNKMTYKLILSKSCMNISI